MGYRFLGRELIRKGGCLTIPISRHHPSKRPVAFGAGPESGEYGLSRLPSAGLRPNKFELGGVASGIVSDNIPPCPASLAIPRPAS